MIATRPDWCISRQRVWGVPIIVFYCERCSEPLTDRAILDRVVALFAEHTADVWYERTAAELIGEGVKCHRCGGAEFRKENDILDVWFDSGSSHLAVLNEEYGLPWPSDMYLEGGDQYRGWFHSSLLIGVGLKGGAPYRECRDARVDARRRRASDVEIAAATRSSRRRSSRNTAPTCCGCGWRRWNSPKTCVVGDDSDALVGGLPQAAQHVSLRAGQPARLRSGGGRGAGRRVGRDRPVDPAADGRTDGALPAWYDELAFHKVYHGVYDFATTELSAVYFDVLKDRLYTAAPKAAARRSGADGDVPGDERVDPAAGSVSRFHGGRSVGIFPQARRQPGKRSSGAAAGAGGVDRGNHGGAAGAAGKLEPVDGSARAWC